MVGRHTINPGHKGALVAKHGQMGCNFLQNSLLMQLFFFSHLSQEERLGAAGNYLKSIRLSFKQLEAVRPEIEANADRYQFLCFQFGLRFLKDLARNVGEIIEALEEDQKYK